MFYQRLLLSPACPRYIPDTSVRNTRTDGSGPKSEREWSVRVLTPDSGSPFTLNDLCFPLPVLGTFLTLRSGTLGLTAAAQKSEREWSVPIDTIRPCSLRGLRVKRVRVLTPDSGSPEVSRQRMLCFVVTVLAPAFTEM